MTFSHVEILVKKIWNFLTKTDTYKNANFIQSSEEVWEIGNAFFWQNFQFFCDFIFLINEIRLNIFGFCLKSRFVHTKRYYSLLMTHMLHNVIGKIPNGKVQKTRGSTSFLTWFYLLSLIQSIILFRCLFNTTHKINQCLWKVNKSSSDGEIAKGSQDLQV